MNREAVISAPAKSGTGWARNLVYAGAALALCLVLPFLTGQIPQIGSALCPMHIPVLLAGFLCGPWVGCGGGSSGSPAALRSVWDAAAVPHRPCHVL